MVCVDVPVFVGEPVNVGVFVKLIVSVIVDVNDTVFVAVSV